MIIISNFECRYRSGSGPGVVQRLHFYGHAYRGLHIFLVEVARVSPKTIQNNKIHVRGVEFFFDLVIFLDFFFLWWAEARKIF